MPYNVFLSYSWSNSAERRVLADKIGAIENVKVLVDDDFISPGDPIHSTVLKMIDASDCLVVLLTREGLQSREVWDEITRAHDRNKVIIPILAEGTKLEEIPWHFRDLRWVSYDLKNFDFVVERVIAAIRKRANPPNIFESPHPATLRMFFSLSLLYWVFTGPWPLVWLFLTSDRNARVCWDIATKISSSLSSFHMRRFMARLVSTIPAWGSVHLSEV
jgi:TIR domain